MTSPQVIRFRLFKVDLRTRELRRDGERIKLPDQSFQILSLLLLRPGQLVTRAEIQTKLWPNDTVVEFENSIHAAVRRLRLALGDPANTPQYIETLARRGYRWILPAEEIEAGPGGSEAVDHNDGIASSVVPDSTHLTGRRLSHYRVLEVVGGGGMGIVYAAEDLKLGRRVALKFLPPELARDARSMQRLQREARAASSLNHPNICTIHGLEEDDVQAFIVMELLEGTTLREVIAHETRNQGRDADESTLPVSTLVDIALQTVDGLEAAHREGIIHRDIKPANLFITTSGRLKILDFGLAKLEQGGSLELDHAPAIHPDHTLTCTGIRLGTAAYMSPEQVRAEKLDTRTDLFSFGLVLYEMATGRAAFSGDTVAVVHNAILHETPPPVCDQNARVPAKLARIISKALEKDRNKRFQSAADLRIALNCLKKESPLRQWLRWWPAIAVLVAIVVALGLYSSITKRSPGGTAPEFRLRQITANSAENHVSSTAISPRGTYIAFADVKGLHYRVVESGQTLDLKLPDSFGQRPVEWECVGWFPSEQQLLVNAHIQKSGEGDWYSTGSSIWILPVFGGPPRMIRNNATAYGLSWDGSLISFGAHKDKLGDRELWVMGPSGEGVRKLYETDENSAMGGNSWSPDGKRIIYPTIGANDMTLVSRDLVGGPPVTVLPPAEMAGVNQFLWLQNGTLVYSKADPGAINTASNLWQLRIDPHAGVATEKPRQITNWTGFGLAALSATNDSRQIAFMGWAHHATVYLGDLRANGTQIGEISHFTLTESQDYIADWAPDSRSILLISNRSGHNALYLQALEKDTPRPLIPDTRGMAQFRISPDGKWVVYFEQTAQTSRRLRLMRTPLDGFRPQTVLETANGSMLSCAKLKDLCVLAQPSDDGGQVIVSSFSLLHGPGMELNRFAVTRSANFWAVDLAPDGNSIAELPDPAGPIRMISLEGRQDASIAPGGLDNIRSVHWSANEDGLFLSNAGKEGTTLWHVGLEGHPRRIWESRGITWAAGLPSPDGRYVALQTSELSSNLWMLERVESSSAK